MIIGINYNWFAVDANGEQFTNRMIGTTYNGRECTEIKEHAAAGEGDKWYYDIVYADGFTQRVFNPNQVFFKTKP